MINNFINYLNEKFDYRLLNGYENLESECTERSDFDFLFKQEDFNNINHIIVKFCEINNYNLVQIYHQANFAKNFFVWDPVNLSLLNLDIYGELSIDNVLLFSEVEIFESASVYKNILILKSYQEFTQYFIKKIKKNDIDENVFFKLRKLFLDDVGFLKMPLKKYFKNTFKIINNSFDENNFEILQTNLFVINEDFNSIQRSVLFGSFKNIFRIAKRIVMPTGLAIGFLGPDGSGKSTIIDSIAKSHLPFRRIDNFHLKPFKLKNHHKKKCSNNPHEFPTYGIVKSYFKLMYFVFQYNIGWIKNIFLIKRKSSLIIFDRYYDDLLVDSKRYRFGGSIKLAQWARNFIPRPEIYIILTTDANVINKRKQEVSFEELKRQIIEYRKLGKLKNYFNVDVNRAPDEIVDEVVTLIMKKLHGRY